MRHIGVKGLHLLISHGQPVQQGIELRNQRTQLLRLVAVVQPFMPMLGQVLGRELARLLDQQMQRLQALAHHPGAGHGDQQGAQHGRQTQRPGQMAQQRLIVALIEQHADLQWRSRRQSGCGRKIHTEVTPLAAAIAQRLAQILKQQAALAVDHAQRQLFVPSQKIAQHMHQRITRMDLPPLDQQLLHRRLLVRQAFLLARGQLDRNRPVHGHANQAQPQHGQQSQSARQALAQMRYELLLAKWHEN